MMNLPELVILDVGHGNCAILEDTIAVTLIDCPPSSTVLIALERLGVNTIDHVLISHADLDHVGGLLNLLDDFVVRNVYINPDADKKSKTWRDIRQALELAEGKGTEIHTSLTSKLSQKIFSGQVEIEILAPSLGVFLGGSGGEDLEGRKLSSNSMSVVIGLVHQSKRVIILTGDLDEIGLDNLLKKQNNIQAKILVFPHHGGNPGNTNGKQFSNRLCSLVHPDLIIFSYGRGRFGNPQEDIIRGVLNSVPDAHIMCTQLSQKCAINYPDADFSHLTTLPAAGYESNGCCGGTISIKMEGERTTYVPLSSTHRTFISNKIPTPLCMSHLNRVKD